MFGVVGTGTNCCYMEDLDQVEMWDLDKDHPKQVQRGYRGRAVAVKYLMDWR